MRRRAFFALLATCSLGVGVTLVLLARDVQRWEDAVAEGDARFQVAPGGGELWDASERVPFGTARDLLAIEDDLRYRQGVYLFRLGRPREATLGRSRVVILRSAAQVELARVAVADPDRRRRGAALNLLGVLDLADSSENPAGAAALLEKASDRFATAVAVDSGNDEAKFNLELTLRRIAKQGRRGTKGGGRPGERASGAGTRGGGSGY